MQYLADQHGQRVAILYQNILLNPSGTVVLGIVLGNCVFDKGGTVRGKYFRHTLFAMDGRVLAKENGIVQHLALELPAVRDTAWELVRGITDHHCPIIDPLNEWAGVPVGEHFRGRGVAISTN